MARKIMTCYQLRRSVNYSIIYLLRSNELVVPSPNLKALSLRAIPEWVSAIECISGATPTPKSEGSICLRANPEGVSATLNSLPTASYLFVIPPHETISGFDRRGPL